MKFTTLKTVYAITCALILFAVPGLSSAAAVVPPDIETQDSVFDHPRTNPNGSEVLDQKKQKKNNYVEGEVIVKFKSKLSRSERQNLHMQNDAEVLDEIPDARLSRVKSKKGESTETLIQRYRKQKDVEYAEPNLLVESQAIPNDPNFISQYGLNNTGQTGGTVDADIDAPEAWDVQTGSASVIVAVIDTGTDYTHPDLAANIWTNPGEIAGNGVDDDGNGFIDDVHGWDFVNNDNAPLDDRGHGTHVAGIIAAEGNNNLGVAGVAWRAQIMALKFLDVGGSGSTWNAILAIRYAARNGAKILNNSWGCASGSDDCFSQALEDTLYEIAPSGTLFVAAAGNEANNNDFSIRGPCSSVAPNVICIAATDNKDQLGDFSNYGSARVDIAAPGVSIYSTVPTIACAYCNASGYLSMSGTSMATPYVSGAAALVLSQFPNLGPTQVKQVLMGSGDLLSGLSGKVLSGRRLNVSNALHANFVISPSSDEVKANVGVATDFNVAINMSALNGFGGSVNLSVTSPTLEISAFLANTTLTPVSGSASTSLAIHVNPAVSKGVYVLPVTASNGSGEIRTISIVVRVLSPDFDVAVGPSTRDVVPGMGANYVVTVVARDGYVKPLTLSLTTSNSSITGSLSQSTVQPVSTGLANNTTIVTLSTGILSSLPLGLHTIQVQVTDGIKTVSKTVTLNYVSSARTPTQAWVSRVAGLAGNEEAQPYLAQGTNGSVYMAGSTNVGPNNWNMLLVKYDANGAELWRAEYDYMSEHDILRGIRVDANGDVYLAGGNAAAKIVKYSGETGTLLWDIYDYTLGVPEDIVNDAAGNIYVLGLKNGFPRLYVVNKYSPDGTRLWSSSYPVGTLGYPYNLKLDGAGNLYAAGYYSNVGYTAYDLMVVKFDPSGQVRWANRYDGGGWDGTFPNAVVDVDTAGNVYISGSSSNGSSLDFLTLKYDTDGAVLWERRFDGGSTDYVSDIKVDGAGNVVVGGYSYSNTWDYQTLKYNAQGDLLWSNRYDHYYNSDIATALDIDAGDNIYVTGRSIDGSYYDYATVKYSPGGQLQWVGRYNGTTSDQAADVLVDGAGNVFVAGVSRNNSSTQDFDLVTVKYLGSPATVPGAPTNVTATAGNASATVSFTPPASNGGVAITRYTVTSSPGGITATGSASPITVTGLTNGVTYTFTVTATNSAGTGPASSPSNSVTPEAIIVPPSAPQNVTATAGNASATVSFTPPASNGGATITSYTVTSSPGGIIGTCAASPCTVSGLTNGTAYTFSVTATNSAGTGPASTPSNSVTPVTVPGAPTNVIATAGNASATVSFTPPADNGGVAIMSYNAISSPGGFVSGCLASPCMFINLVNGTAYTFTVIAINKVGVGPASAPSNSVTPATVPGAPTNVTATAGNASATVIFLPPASNGGAAITSYTATSSPGSITGTCAASPCTVTGLTGGTSYTFTVTATNSVGTGPASVASNSVIPLDGTPPVVTPSLTGGTYTWVPSVALSANEPATIYYTLDGSTPTTASSVYTMAILVNSSMTIKYFAVDTAGNASAVQAQSYTINLPTPGMVVAWGDNTYSQSTVPAGLGGVIALSGGLYHTVALKSDGTVAAWGDNTYGQTAIPEGLNGVVAVAAGAYHTLALKSDGTLVAWGLNWSGQTVIPAGLSGVVAVAASGYHSVALKSDGTVVAWGSNSSGQTVIPAGLDGVVAITAGFESTIALKNDGTVVTWGRNDFGQTTVPAGLSGVVAVAAGAYHTVALKSDGTVMAWGNIVYATVPAGLNDVKAIAAGGLHTLALKSDGTVVAWGENTSGQITVPVGLSAVVAIAAGNYSSLAVVADTVAPSVPTKLTATAFSTTQINLTWRASTDNFGVTGYKVYRNGVQVGAPTGTSYSDTGLKAATSYKYTVAACDAAGNCSAQSAAVTGTTKRK